MVKLRSLPLLVVLGVLGNPQPVSALQITEIHYHPRASGPEAERLEWVEIFNDSATPADLSDYHFAAGIRFAFPRGFILEGHAYLVVASDAARFRALHPDVENVTGDFEGRLENGGERLAIANESGAVVCSVRYDRSPPWPAVPDGTGYTLALSWPFADPRDPRHWRASLRPGGTPGRENFPPPPEVAHELIPETGMRWRLRRGWDPVTETMAPFSDPPGAWIAPEFDDSAWEEAESPIGYGEEDLRTELSDMKGRYLAFALRGRFELREEDLSGIDRLEITIKVDDGCVLYLNGAEIARVGLEGERGELVPADASARSARELRLPALVLRLPPDRLRVGTNVLAVQVHNSSLNSADAGLILKAETRAPAPEAAPPFPPLRIHEIGIDKEGRAFLELEREPGPELDLSDYALLTDPVARAGFPLPAGAFFPAGERFLAVPIDPGLLPAPERPVSLFFFAPDGETVLDAVRLRLPSGIAGPWSFARTEPPGGTLRFLVSRVPTPGGENRVDLETAVVINEIHYHPPPGAEDLEFLELHNPTDRPASLDRFRLAGGYNYAFPPGTTLGPGGYLVVAREPEAVRAAYGLPPGVVVGPETEEARAAFGVLRNSGECVRLLDPLGNPADEVCYADGGDWDALADGDGSSLELADPFADNSAPHAWRASDESQRAPWEEFAFEAVYSTRIPPLPMESELHIFLLESGEFLLDDVSVTQGDPPREFIQNGGFEESTAPWRLTGTHSRSFRTTAEAATGIASLHVIARGSGDNRVNRIETDTFPILRDGPVRVSFRARWLRGCDRIHVSGYNNAFGRTITLARPLTAGTPGRENTARARLRELTGAADLGPVISDVHHEPAVPPPFSPVRVSARVRDPQGVARVTLHHRLDGTEDFEATPLRDDGRGGDLRAGDGVYSAEIDAPQDGARVQFYVEAEDGGGRTSTYPRAAPAQTLLFIADDGFFINEGHANALHRYRLIVDQENLRELNTRLLHSDELVRGTFVFEEREVYYNVGLRYRGSPWNRPPTPRMFRVRFRDDRRFRGEARKINLSRYGRDQHEGTAYYLIRKASSPEAKAPYSPVYEYINVSLNGRPHSTVPMAEVRPVDTVYTQFWWPGDSEGWNWKITGKLAFTDSGQRAPSSPVWTELRYYGPSPEDVRFYYNPGIRKRDDVFEPLIELLRVADRSQTPDAEFEERLEAVLNVESSLRVFAVRAFLADWDTIGIGNGQNAYLYYAPLEGRHYLLPWDMDHTFERQDPPLFPPPSSVGIGRILVQARYRRLYASILAENLAGPWSPDELDAWLDRVFQATARARVAAPRDMTSFLAARRRRLEAELRTGMAVPFEVTSPNPDAAPGTSREIAGTAPIPVRHVLAQVGGGPLAPLDLRWEGRARVPVEWRAEIGGLAPGSNEVTLFALDASGAAVATAQVVLINTEVVFVRGDADGDGALTGADALRVLSALFAGGSLSCLDAADADDDGRLSVTDAVRILRHLFTGGPPPAAPYPEEGLDPTPEDPLDCAGR